MYYKNYLRWNHTLHNYPATKCSGHSAPLLLAPAEGLGALRALLGAFGPLLSRSIQKYSLRRLFGHLLLQNPLRFFLSHFIWLPQEAYWEVREGAKGPLSWVHTSLGTWRVPQLSAGARRRVAVGHPNLLVSTKLWNKIIYIFLNSSMNKFSYNSIPIWKSIGISIWVWCKFDTHLCRRGCLRNLHQTPHETLFQMLQKSQVFFLEGFFKYFKKWSKVSSI